MLAVIDKNAVIFYYCSISTLFNNQPLTDGDEACPYLIHPNADSATHPTNSQKDKNTNQLEIFMNQQNKSTYTATDLNAFKQLLLKARDETRAEISKFKESLADPGDHHINHNHMAENGTDAMELSKIANQVTVLSKYLQKIEHALTRIANGNYGVCGHCAKTIPRERLMIVPVAKECRTCKEKGNQQSRIYSGARR